MRWRPGRFAAHSFRGWLFCLDRPAFSVQDLSVGDVVADLASARLSQAYLLQKLRDTVVTTERVRLARDLHDGVLQTLTGAALQLQAARRTLTVDPAAAEERLSQVQRIIAAGQNDLRFFINQLGPQRAGESGPIDLRGPRARPGRSDPSPVGRPRHRGDRAGVRSRFPTCS